MKVFRGIGQDQGTKTNLFPVVFFWLNTRGGGGTTAGGGGAKQGGSKRPIFLRQLRHCIFFPGRGHKPGGWGGDCIHDCVVTHRLVTTLIETWLLHSQTQGSRLGGGWSKLRGEGGVMGHKQRNFPLTQANSDFTRDLLDPQCLNLRRGCQQFSPLGPSSWGHTYGGG